MEASELGDSPEAAVALATNDEQQLGCVKRGRFRMLLEPKLQGRVVRACNLDRGETHFDVGAGAELGRAQRLQGVAQLPQAGEHAAVFLIIPTYRSALFYTTTMTGDGKQAINKIWEA